MRLNSTRAQAFACGFVLFALVEAPSCLQAQTGGSPVLPVGEIEQHRFGHASGFHAINVPIPRTYSYYYATWFNQPRHFRVVGPDGKAYWRRTVRGLPLGTPWSSDGFLALP
jgi:hypothetical protein